MAEAAAPRQVSRRTFLGWWMAALMTATVITGGLPILVYLWPAPPKGQRKQVINVALDTPISGLADDSATKFLAPTTPNEAFIMATGGGDNAPGDLAFGGFVVKTGGNVQVFAQNCSHLGCSVNFAPATSDHPIASFDCPCHGSRFHLDGTVLRGPAQYPLSTLTWKQGSSPNQIQIDGITLG